MRCHGLQEPLLDEAACRGFGGMCLGKVTGVGTVKSVGSATLKANAWENASGFRIYWSVANMGRIFPILVLALPTPDHFQSLFFVLITTIKPEA